MSTYFGSHSLIFDGYFKDPSSMPKKREAVSSAQFLSELIHDLNVSDKADTKNLIVSTVDKTDETIPDDVLLELSRREHSIDNISTQLYAFFAEGRERDRAPSEYIRRHNRLVEYSSGRQAFP